MQMGSQTAASHTRMREPQVGQASLQACGQGPWEGCSARVFTTHPTRDGMTDSWGHGPTTGDGQAADTDGSRQPSPKVQAHARPVIHPDREGCLGKFQNRPWGLCGDAIRMVPCPHDSLHHLTTTKVPWATTNIHHNI